MGQAGLILSQLADSFYNYKIHCFLKMLICLKLNLKGAIKKGMKKTILFIIYLLLHFYRNVLWLFLKLCVKVFIHLRNSPFFKGYYVFEFWPNILFIFIFKNAQVNKILLKEKFWIMFFNLKFFLKNVFL